MPTANPHHFMTVAMFAQTPYSLANGERVAVPVLKNIASSTVHLSRSFAAISEHYLDPQSWFEHISQELPSQTREKY